MNIVLQLLNERGDELGRLPMQTVRLVPAGAATAPPDLRGDMAEAGERITLALAQEGMAPALDPIGLRLAVARALLAPEGASDEETGGEVRIPLPVRPLGRGPGDPDQRPSGPAGRRTDPLSVSDAGGGTPHGPESPGAASDDGDWDDLFALDGPDGPLADEGDLP